ncbi:uncharacterized protein SAPINGB_P002682 [Magnusiomyces paraingens]|uniref:Uncharacterized protein n=1 Tax=Magnusiomyces paraingens TaxID=2606893 RepID=A0A5E8BF62_9ASCO|nr:uncharacterized protein SAPINGB_P002682 [Saprochaete ingens]VVT50263.1 unnamed protein product [Saprochaete ingens]
MSDTSGHSSEFEDEFEDSQDEYVEEKPVRKPIRFDKGKNVTRKRVMSDAEEIEEPENTEDLKKGGNEKAEDADNSDSSIEEVNKSEPKKKRPKKTPKEIPRGTLKAVKTRVPVREHNMKWPIVSAYGLSQILSIFESEAIACLSDLQAQNSSKKLSKKQQAEEDAQIADFQEAQAELVKQMTKELRRLPVPPSTRDTHYSLDALARQNEQLEAAAAAMDKQVADLEAEIAQEEAELARDEAYLRELVSNSRSQIRARRALVRKQMTTSAASRGGVNFLEGIEVRGDIDDNGGGGPAAHYVDLLGGALVVDDSVDGLNIVGSSDDDDERDSDEEVSFVDSDEEDGAIGLDDEDDELRVFQDRGMTHTQLDRIREELRRGYGMSGEDSSDDGEEDKEMAEMLARLEQNLGEISQNASSVASLLNEVTLCHSELAMLQRDSGQDPDE